MKKILFLIHDLGQGGAEKVLVNLVNNMDTAKFDISVTALFGGGVNEQFLAPHVHYQTVFPKSIPGNSHLMKLLTPKQLHRLCVKEHYDIEVSYLEGPSARVISGCEDPKTELICWFHSTPKTTQEASKSFRSEAEAISCYGKFRKVICVSRWMKESFEHCFPSLPKAGILYNTVESDRILEQSSEPVEGDMFRDGKIHLIGVGSMKPVKGFDRLIRIHDRLCQGGYPIRTILLGQGPDLGKLQQQAKDCGRADSVVFPGYQTNPYKFVAKSDLFVCSSHAEGFSTAVTESLIVGTPVCTMEVSGMKEMLGENNEWGIVTENGEEALYEAIRDLLDHPEKLAHYKEKAAQRGKRFSTEETVRAVEEMLLNL